MGVDVRRLIPQRVTRRGLIGGALVAGAAVSGLRLLGLDRAVAHVKNAVLAKPGPATVDWSSPLGAEAARIAHLLRRTTFGATPADLEAALKLGYGQVVEKLIETPPAEPGPVPGMNGGGINVPVLQQWWIDHMLATPTPFAEQLTLFWHGHFTSDTTKVGTGQPYLYWQNLTWRRMAMTDLGSMLMQVTTDPAMMVYLDLATSTGKSPNENYSRELMELFTLGAGKFTEDDVRAAARGLAGWRLPTNADNSKIGVFDKRRAYTGGSLTFLGKNGNLDTQGVIDGILANPATAPFIVTKIVHHLVSPSPEARYIARLADEFRASKYDMKTLMRSVFLSPEFISGPSVYRALVKSPVEYMVSALKALGASQLSRLVVSSGQNMGQMLFDPPDVGGWPDNDSWLSSNTIIARVNFVVAAMAGLRTVPAAKDAIQQLLDGVISPVTKGLLDGAGDDRARWLTALISPEFNLK